MGWFDKIFVSPGEDNHGLSDDEWQSVALKYIGNRLSNADTVWPSQHNIDWAETQLASLKTWVSEIADARMKRACGGWVKYGELNLMEEKKNLASEQKKREVLKRLSGNK